MSCQQNDIIKEDASSVSTQAPLEKKKTASPKKHKIFGKIFSIVAISISGAALLLHMVSSIIMISASFIIKLVTMAVPTLSPFLKFIVPLFPLVVALCGVVGVVFAIISLIFNLGAKDLFGTMFSSLALPISTFVVIFATKKFVKKIFTKLFTTFVLPVIIVGAVAVIAFLGDSIMSIFQ